jgi:hypothetical protein
MAAADKQREYYYDYLYRQSVGPVKKIAAGTFVSIAIVG